MKNIIKNILIKKNDKLFQDLLLNFFFIFILCLLFLITRKVSNLIDYNSTTISKEDSMLRFDKNIFLFVNAGHKKMISSYVWIMTLIQADLERYAKKDNFSWLFLRFKMISELDPYYIEVYKTGGLYLSVISDDIPAATYLFDKGLKYFPDDFDLNLKAGYHYYFEENQIQKAINCFNKIKNNSRAPIFIKSLISKLMAEKGDLYSAYEFLNHFYEKEKENLFLKKRYLSQLNNLRIEIDLECLNKNSVNSKCNEQDLKGISYVKKNGTYFYPQEWEKLRAIKRK
jgi:hypothetical protein